MRRLVLVVLLVATACSDPVTTARMDQLERELALLRSARQPSAVGEAIGTALAPLRDAVDTFARRGEAERSRWSAVTAEVGQLATLVHGIVDDTRRAQLEELRQRLAGLEVQAKAQTSVQAEESALLLRALETTATRLEAFLREVGPPAARTTPPAKDTARDAGQQLAERKSELHPAWVLAAGLLGGVLLALAVRRRRKPVRRPSVVELPSIVVDAPAPASSASPLCSGPRAAGTSGPLALRAVVASLAPEATVATLRRWLADEPRVLAEPAPRCDVRGRAVHVEFHVSSALPAAERAGLVAEVQLHEPPVESQVGRRTA